MRMKTKFCGGSHPQGRIGKQSHESQPVVGHAFNTSTWAVEADRSL